MQLKMFRAFMQVPVEVCPFLSLIFAWLIKECLNVTRLDSTLGRGSKVLQLPSPVLDTIFDQLDVLDRCAFALCCKTVLRHAFQNEHLEYILQHPPRIDDLQYFFERQLARGWIPHNLKYCSDCGKFVSTESAHWRLVSEKYSRELSGRISNLWRGRRNDGWLRYWIERWCDEGHANVDAAAFALRREDTTRPICPRCAVLNPECNIWRLRRMEAAHSSTHQHAQKTYPERTSSLSSTDPQSNHDNPSLPAHHMTLNIKQSQMKFSGRGSESRHSRSQNSSSQDRSLLLLQVVPQESIAGHGGRYSHYDVEELYLLEPTHHTVNQRKYTQKPHNAVASINITIAS